MVVLIAYFLCVCCMEIVDMKVKREAEQKLAELQERMDEIEGEINTLAADEKAIRDEARTIKAERVNVSSTIVHSSIMLIRG